MVSALHVWRFTALIGYGLYTCAGLRLLGAAFVRKGTESWAGEACARGLYALPHMLSWPQSVLAFAAANVSHASLHHGSRAGLTMSITFIAFITLVEEIGLRTGLVFGDYHFTTPGLGIRATDRLPALVPLLWLCLAYPSAILGSLTLRAFRFSWVRSHPRWWFALLSSTWLAAFDWFSDPVGSSLGHAVWEGRHPAPDWRFARPPGDVPLQNTLGWFCTGCLLFLMPLTCNENLASASDRQMPLPNRRSYGKLQRDTLRNTDQATRARNKRLRARISMPPNERKGTSRANRTRDAGIAHLGRSFGFAYACAPLFALFSTAVFYGVHPAHPHSIALQAVAYLGVACLALAAAATRTAYPAAA